MSVQTMYDTNRCDKCWSPVFFVDYGMLYKENNAYDGWGHIECGTCGYKVGRWSEKVLGENEFEDVSLRYKN